MLIESFMILMSVFFNRRNHNWAVKATKENGEGWKVNRVDPFLLTTFHSEKVTVSLIITEPLIG